LGVSILVLDVENDEGVRARIFEFLDHPSDLLRVLLVKHCEGVMSDRDAGEGNKSSAREHGSEIGLHAFPPFGICTYRRLRRAACGDKLESKIHHLAAGEKGLGACDDHAVVSLPGLTGAIQYLVVGGYWIAPASPAVGRMGSVRA